MKMTNQYLLIFIVATSLLMGCTENQPTKEVAVETPSAAPSLLNTEVNLANNQLVADAATEPVSAQPNTKVEESADQLTPGALAGKHALTIQWISWDKPGEITFTSIGNDKYEVEGSQMGEKSGECPDCYLKIKGVVTEITPKKLEFTGIIKSSIYHIQDGEVCTKEGTFDFLSTQDRKYWRCQKMDGCDGVTDYVDIYF